MSALPATQPASIIGAQWPALSRAISRYDENTAETFSRMAYDAVEGGLIRLDARRRLAATALAMGIRDFDAQLLIACAIRRWALDRRYDAGPSKTAPRLSFEYRSWKLAMMRVALVLGTAAALDALILWKWLS